MNKGNVISLVTTFLKNPRSDRAKIAIVVCRDMLKEYAVQMAKADLLDPLVTFVFLAMLFPF